MSELPMRDRVTALLRNGKWSRWISRGTWTLIDRGLFALSNFALNVTLARWMSLEAYGAFAIAFSIFLVIAAAQSSLVIGPLLVFGPMRYRDSYAAYLGLLIKGQMALSILVSSGLALAGAGFLLWGSHEIGVVLFALAAAGPFILQLWLLRQSGYVQLRAKRAAGAGAVYLGLVLAGTFVLYRLEVLSPTTALLLMAVASLVVAIWLAIQQRPKFDRSLLGAFSREVAVEHWRYARWMLPARLLVAARNNLFFFILPIWGGLEATAALRALVNLTMPISFMQHSLSVIIIPIFARARNSNTLQEKALLCMAFFVLTAVLYGLGLIVFQEELIRWIYAGQYDDYRNLIWLFSILLILHSVSSVLSSILAAIEKPKYVFSATFAGVLAAVTLGVGAVSIAAEVGAIIGLLFSEFVVVILLIWYVRLTKQSDATGWTTKAF